eukprot:4411166-Pleurochrysis_carterae.AAC.2
MGADMQAGLIASAGIDAGEGFRLWTAHLDSVGGELGRLAVMATDQVLARYLRQRRACRGALALN